MPIPLEKQVSLAFERYFAGEPSFVVQAPGRVNLIGEHTDYNDGFVFPLAINRCIWIAGRPRSDREVMLYSVDFDDTCSFKLQYDPIPLKGWKAYPQGVGWALTKAGYELKGWEGVVISNLPRGAGLSSSAAMELAVARGFAAASGFNWEPVAMAHVARHAENAWVGMPCGIMDQLVCAAGRAGHALLIDCRSLETQPFPMPSGSSVVIMDTGTRRGLVESLYAERRNQCIEAAKACGRESLRDITLELLEASAGGMSREGFQRSWHVVTENERTVDAARCMTNGDVGTLGELMIRSHQSLRNDFQVSCPELDMMVDIATDLNGCFGARMTGAGFGGCAVGLVDSSRIPYFLDSVKKTYSRHSGLTPTLYVVEAVDGASVSFTS